MLTVSSKEITRDRVLISIRMKTKNGSKLTPQDAWVYLLNQFDKHPTIEIEAARIYPDLDKPNEEQK